MTAKELIDIYWTHDILLEKEFLKTTDYVRIDAENYSAFSVAYAGL